ncbi:ATP-binding protein [Streptomyces sp. NPDC047525]|uniref:ATP-binding protein n=1 Tax=Streptomyces sp. NPDC047525 TaxID=3155264 RepID=UPI0033C13515
MSPREAECWAPGRLPPEGLRRAWAHGQCGEVRITGAEVLRISSSLAAAVLAVLAAEGTPLGLVLDTRARGTVEFIVPAGTVDTWPSLLSARCVSDAVLRCPGPEVTTGPGPRPGSGGRAWITPPVPGARPTTDPDRLREAVTAVLGGQRAPAPHTTSTPGGPPMTVLLRKGRSQFSAQWNLPGASSFTPAAARRHVYGAACEQGIPPSAADDLCVITSELTTNAIRHTHSSVIFVWLHVTDTEALVGVLDQGPRPHQQLSAQRPAPTEETGRGLALAEALAARWASSPVGRGTAVEAAVTLPQAGGLNA